MLCISYVERKDPLCKNRATMPSRHWSGNRCAITWQFKMTVKLIGIYIRTTATVKTKVKSHQNRPRRPRGGEEV